MTWTHFHDMHSGGGQKLDWGHIYIEAPEDEARAVFYNRFGRNPARVTCTCCGEDYSLSEYPTLAQATGFQRNCDTLVTPRDPRTGRYVHPEDEWFKAHYYLDPEDVPEALERGWAVEENSYRKYAGHGSDFGRYLTVDEYAAKDDVLIIPAEDIANDERTADIPAEGYVWAGS